MTWHMTARRRRGLAGADLAALGIPSEAEYLQTYLSAPAARASRVSRRVAYYLVFNMFRLVGILQGIVARALQGNASTPQALEPANARRPLAEQAWALAQRIGKG
jgi:aminoglycoside phosphotransferase (APT) family kinase protein